MKKRSDAKWSDVGGQKVALTSVKPLGNSQAQAVIAAKGGVVFHRSKGCPDEAMKGNVRLTLILLLDGQKSSLNLQDGTALHKP